MHKGREKRPLLLVTDEFPFGLGEPFLESEMPHLCDAFDVTIASTSSSVATVRPLEAGVSVHHYAPRKGLVRFIEILRYVTMFFFSPICIRECVDILRGGHPRISRILSSLKFFVGSERFYHWLKAEGMLQAHGGGIFYSYWSNWKLLAILRRRSEFPNMNVLTRLHGYDLYQERYQDGRQPFKRFMDSRLDQVHFVSEFGMRYYMKAFQITQSSRHVLSRLGTQNSHGMGPYQRDGVFDLVSCSNVVPLKRIHLIIDALALIDDIDIHWQHFGGGVDLQKMQDYARDKLHHKGNIRYTFHGAVSNHRVLEHYATNKVDCFVTTSSTEGAPVSIMEALSFGVPVLAPAVGGIPDMLAGIPHNMLSEAAHPQEVCKGLEELLNLDVERMAALRLSCRETWERRFMASQCYGAFVSHLNNLTNHRP